jgi:Putative MetA-pathway of phenol degradation
LSYGIVDSADLQLTLPYLRQKADDARASGKLDFAVDVKWRFYEDGPLSLGLKPGLTFPSGRDEEGLGTGRSTWGSLAILSYDREGWAFHSHIGYRHNRNKAGQRTSLRHISASFWMKPNESLKLVSDYSLDTNPDPSSDRTVRQTVLGFIYSVTPTLDLDVGARFGNTPAIHRALLFGTTLRW